MLTGIRIVYEKAKDLQQAIVAVPPLQRPAESRVAMQKGVEMSRAGARVEIPDLGIDVATLAAFNTLREASLGG